MSKETLFEAIRKQDAVLWIGAGFSKYAGYISGQELSEKLYNEIDISKRTGLKPYDLQNVVQALKDLHKEEGEKKMQEILKAEFIDKEPISTEYHDKLSNISHIKTIITTNYDRLLELSYKDKSQVIYHDNHVVNIDEKKVQIFKIHGDLEDHDSIILARNDYGNFFLNGKEKNIWAVVSERIATKVQVFIGYSLEDINVDYILDKIWNNMNTKKTCYLVAPNLPDYKIANIENRGIVYINSTGEEFISDLYDNVTKNIIKDFKANNIDPEILRKFLKENSLKPTIEGDENKYSIISITPINNIKLIADMNFKLSVENSKKLQDLMNSGIDFELKLPVTDYSLHVKEIPISDIYETEEIVFKRKSKIIDEFSIDVKFTETGFEKTDIPVKIIETKGYNEIHINLKSGDLIINLVDDPSDISKYHFNVRRNHNPHFGKIKDEMEFNTLLLNLFSGNEFTIYSKGKMLFTDRSPIQDKELEVAKFLIDYCEKLSIIENYYKVRFENFEMTSIDQDSYNNASVIAKIITTEKIELPFEGGQLEVDVSDFMILECFKDGKKVRLKMLSEECKQVELHNQLLIIGYEETEFNDMILINIKEAENGGITVLLKSESKSRKIKYISENKHNQLIIEVLPQT